MAANKGIAEDLMKLFSLFKGSLSLKVEQHSGMFAKKRKRRAVHTATADIETLLILLVNKVCRKIKKFSLLSELEEASFLQVKRRTIFKLR